MIKDIIELKEVYDYLISRNLVNQYKKAKNYILSGNLKSVFFKKRQPKTSKIYQFRINSKYRAFGYYEKEDNSVFRVIKISDHQDF